ncbi:MAG: AAA family ATPase [Bacteroidota bacterium]
MNEILILTGACGVGKTTVARQWARGKNGVAIEADYFTEWIHDDSFERFTQEEEKLVANLTFVTAQEYLKQNMPIAIDEVWSPYGLNILKNKFEREEDICLKFVWLYCKINENHRRNELRVPENQMKNRVDIVNEELRSYQWESYVHKIDTTKITVQETLNIIE